MPTDPLSFFTNLGKETVEDEAQKVEEGSTGIVAKEVKQEAPPKKEKEVQVKELAAAKKKAEERAEAAEKRLAELEELKHLEPVKEYIAKKNGKFDPEGVNNFIEKNKKRKAELEDTKKKVLEKDGKLKELDIFQSDEWNQDYKAPIDQASEVIFADLANLDREGNVKNPQFIQHLHKIITSPNEDGTYKSAIQIKSVLKKFGEEYLEKTGEEYEVPHINTLVDSVKSYAKRRDNASSAYRKWNDVLAERKKNKDFEEDQKRQAALKRELENTEYAHSVAVESFDYKSVKGLFEDEEIKEKLAEVHSNVKLIKTGQKEGYAYPELVKRMAKAEMFDTLVEKHRELEKKYQQEFKVKYSGLPASSNDTSSKRDEAQTDKVKPGTDPLRIFKY